MRGVNSVCFRVFANILICLKFEMKKGAPILCQM